MGKGVGIVITGIIFSIAGGVIAGASAKKAYDEYKALDKFKEGHIVLTDNNKVRYRVSLEIDEKAATEEEMDSFLEVLNKPLAKGLCYMGNVTLNRSLEVLPSSIKEIKRKLAAGIYRKVQVTYLAKMCETDEEMFKELDKGVKLLLPYYNFIMN